jgi:hypothetical protein
LIMRWLYLQRKFVEETMIDDDRNLSDPQP